MAKKIYVGNLSFQTTEADVSELFGNVGQVESVQIITDRDTGRSKGFGFVQMTDDAAAEKAIAALNGKEVNGQARSGPGPIRRAGSYHFLEGHPGLSGVASS